MFSFTTFPHKLIAVFTLKLRNSPFSVRAWYILVVNGIISFWVLTLYLLEISNNLKKPHVEKLSEEVAIDSYLCVCLSIFILTDQESTQIYDTFTRWYFLMEISVKFGVKFILIYAA